MKCFFLVQVKAAEVLWKLYIILRRLFIFPGMTCLCFLKCCLLDLSSEINACPVSKLHRFIFSLKTKEKSIYLSCF